MKDLKIRLYDEKTKEPTDVENLYFFEEQGVQEIENGKAVGRHYTWDAEFYAGETDIDGVDLFGGDILRDMQDHNIWLVGFVNGCFVAHAPDDIVASAFLDDYDFVKIGNKHQNPELLVE